MTSAENSVSEPPNLKIFWGRPPYKARAFGTRNNAPPVTKNLATALAYIRGGLITGIKCLR